MHRLHTLPLLIAGLTLGGCVTTHQESAYQSDRNPGIEPAVAPAAFMAVAPSTRPTSPPVPPIITAVQDVEDAPDIHAAVDAYSHGLTIDPSDLALHKAYVRKVVDLSVPQLGAEAATKVLAQEPNASLARAVTAFMEARDGNLIDALTDITLAVRRAPHDPFVQRTAGHLLAWYDNNPRPTALPGTVRIGLQSVHASLDETQIFADSYNDAADYYRARQAQIARAAARPTTGPVSNGSLASGPTTRTTEPSVAAGSSNEPLPPEQGPDYGGGYVGGGGVIAPPPTYAPYAPPPIYDPGYVYGGYDYPYPYWNSGLFISSGFGFFPFFDLYHRHHDRNHEGDGHHNGDGHHDRGSHGAVAGTGRGDVYLPTGPTHHHGANPVAGQTGTSGHAGNNLTGRNGASFGGGNAAISASAGAPGGMIFRPGRTLHSSPTGTIGITGTSIAIHGAAASSSGLVPPPASISTAPQMFSLPPGPAPVFRSVPVAPAAAPSPVPVAPSPTPAVSHSTGAATGGHMGGGGRR